MKLFANYGFIKNTIIHITVILCDSGISKHFESIKN